jgi:hypothetical protein
MYTILLLHTHAILVGALGASWCEITDVCPPACKRLSLLACAQYSYSLYIYPRARKGISIEEEDSCCFEKLDVSRPFAVIPLPTLLSAFDSLCVSCLRTWVLLAR